MALLSWTGWNKNKSAESRLRLLQPPVFGRVWTSSMTSTASTSSIHQGTLTSRLKWSVACASLDGAVTVLCSVGGVEPQTETVWRQGNKYKVPRMIFVNKMDRAGADFLRVVEQVAERLGANAVPVQLPIGAEENFAALSTLSVCAQFTGMRQTWVPPMRLATSRKNLQAEAQVWRDKMIEAAAEGDEALLDKFVENGELDEDEIRSGLRARTTERRNCRYDVRFGIQEQRCSGHAGRSR